MNMLKQEVEQKVKEKGLKLVWVDTAIGVRRDDTIYLNKNILKYPDYCKKVVDHEIRHTSSYSKHDFLMDCKEATLWDNFVFSLRHPKGFLAFVPIDKYNNKWYIDYTTLTIYFIVVLILYSISHL